MTIELRKAGFGCRIGTLGPIIVSVIEGKPEIGLTYDLEAVQDAQLSKYGRFSSMSVIATPRLEPPPAEFCDRTALLSEKYAKVMVGTAIVILSTGAAAVVARGFLAAWALVMRPDSPQKTFRALAPAAQWLQALEAQPPEVKALADFASDLEAFVAPPKP